MPHLNIAFAALAAKMLFSSLARAISLYDTVRSGDAITF